MSVKEIGAIDLHQWLTGNATVKPVLIDVREPWEIELANIKQAKLIPMGRISEQLNSLSQGQPYVIFCHHGIRSMKVALFLMQNGFSNIMNLQGGIEAWYRNVDNSIGSY